MKNIIKTLVTDNTFMFERKGVDEYRERNWANILISSNETIPLDIETSDRRFNVVTTGGDLPKEVWYDHQAIMSEVAAFA